jgi:branched-chain amino acid transport system permease protein
MPQSLKKHLWFVLMTLAAIALPLLLRGKYEWLLHPVVVIGISTITVLGLNLLMGYAGQVSLGQAAFVGIGAYSYAIISTKPGWSPWLGLLVGIALSALVAAIVGVPLLKLRGHYLAMGTLGFGMILQIVMVQWESLTNGTTGIPGIPPLQIAGFAFSGNRMYYPVAAAVLLSMLLAKNLIDSRVGRALRAVHTSEVAAAVSGVDTSRYKQQVFVLSAALAGLAGGLLAADATYIVSDSFGFHSSMQFVIMTVIGGMASIGGAIFGAAAVTFLNEYLRAFQEYSAIIFGAILIIIMMFFPEGLLLGLGGLGRHIRLPRRRASSPPEAKA